MDLGLKQRIALVTGSTRGIGRATAELLAREGAYVAIAYHQQRDQAEALAEDLIRQGTDSMTIQLDLESVDSIKSAVEAVGKRWDRIDILVNNALATPGGLGPYMGPFEGLTYECWQRLLRNNIEGTYATIQSVVPWMRRNRWGRIVNVSSTAAVDGAAGLVWYSTAKASLYGLTRSLAKEMACDGILVNIVMPGATLTRIMEEVSPEVRHALAKMSLLRRLMKPEEVASSIVYLASAANTAITGESLRVSGGSAC